MEPVVCVLRLIRLAVTLKLRYICFYCSIECQSSDSFYCAESEKQSFLYEGVSTVPPNALPDFSPVHIGLSPNTRVAGDIKVNSYFKTKRELMLRMKKWALEWKFEYKTVSSNKSRVLLSCVDENCTWRMRAIKLPVSDFFVVKKYVHEHTCDTTHRKANHRQASAKLLGSLISSNYGEKRKVSNRNRSLNRSGCCMVFTSITNKLGE
ncbi:unnamed protein product [Brassica rapa]|uniref:Transposase MuDR plant domain-containing protein n=1 Tax=Brassica campestris TaxID=3711 RepID=A0A8D9M4H4_BRACM|nr:unnamed protein product [Brassica rapa]